MEVFLMQADVVVDLQYGDCGKGKVTHHLCRTQDYTHVVRYNGGCNAGHTIYHNGKRFITHHIPAGVFFGVKSIIGPGCVINPDQFFKEIKELNDGGINTDGLIFIAKNTHIITEKHKKQDSEDTTIGTTRSGNGPAYRDKYSRDGIRASTIPVLKDYMIDMYEELHSGKRTNILFEGAQGFGLDIDWGDYPYVTSSHCTSGAALLNGVPPQAIKKVWGVAKMYETYVGAKKFEPDNEIFSLIRNLGQEYGATTGRPRQCNWMNWDLVDKAININGVTDLVFNKVDILDQVGRYKLYHKGELIKFENCEQMKDWINEAVATRFVNVYFSGDKDRI
jgi:adenylosuccinate synthase